MRIPPRVLLLCVLCCFPTLSFAQAVSLVSGGAHPAHPGYAERAPVPVSSVSAGYSINAITINAATGKVISGASGTAHITANRNAATEAASNNNFDLGDTRNNQPTIDGLNTIATFDGAFVAEAGGSQDGNFRFTMIGNDPRVGGSTVYPANIDEVSLQLLNADGSVFKTVPFGPFEQKVLNSPNFVPLNYRSGHNIEYADAAHRAEFFNIMKSNWHTVISPQVVNRVTITVPFTVDIELENGDTVQARAYFTGTAADGSTFVEMLSPLFNFFFDNEVVNEINLGNFTTNSINMTLFPNTFLFDLNTSNPNTPGSCCELGFHTYFLEGGVFPQPRWITEYASWISPGLFGAGFQDVTALSHETSESFDDPFIDNSTPNWQFPGQPANSTVCQANLEIADPIEGLANATSAIEVKQHGTNTTYHPQNVALYQWFEMGATSSAIDGAFSFPNETVLPTSAIPCPGS
ncbi:MAG TPA: hypothetical protein VK574_03375 [Terracidiphilus sp.]|nr:hypothetical protein [Terracidiphilus sp.]